MLQRLRDSVRVVKAVAVGLSVLTAVYFVAGASCDAESRLLPPPSVTSSTAPANTGSIDYSTITLARVPGTTTTVPLATNGGASMQGFVTGPDGALPGATVRLERLVGDQIQRIDVVTDATAKWSVANVPGGRYRVRAFLAPMYAQAAPEIFFLPGNAQHDLNLQVVAFTGRTVEGVLAPSPPLAGEDVNLLVRVADRTVDGDGVGRATPVAGETVEIRGTGLVALGSTIEVTGSAGTAVFEMRCAAAGPILVSALLGAAQEVYPLELPPCGAPPPASTSPSTIEPPSSTTTTTEP
jgi:hypothetical protein